MEEFNVGVLGAGYVGLVTGTTLAHIGHRVACLDKDEERLTLLQEGRVPFYEPGLEDLVARGVESGRLSFAGPEGLKHLAREAQVIFIAVDTPQGQDGSADLSSVAAVARSIGGTIAQASPPTRRERPLVVVNKSTVPVGSGDYVSMLIREGLEEASEGKQQEEEDAFCGLKPRVLEGGIGRLRLPLSRQDSSGG